MPCLVSLEYLGQTITRCDGACTQIEPTHSQVNSENLRHFLIHCSRPKILKLNTSTYDLVKSEVGKTSVLHTMAAPAVQAAVKTELFYGNDTIVVFFFAANKKRQINAQVALTPSNT